MTIDVTKYQPVISGVLAKLRTMRNQKDDLAQECYVALLERQSELGGADDLEKAATICRAAVKAVRAAQNPPDVKKSNRIKFVSADNPNIARQVAKIAIPDAGEISESELYDAIETLDYPVRDVIRALFIGGFTRQRAAAVLGITEDAVRWRKKLGVEALRKYFEVDTNR
jgi:RNA polymerase sigma factor (sigma-70 family)